MLNAFEEAQEDLKRRREGYQPSEAKYPRLPATQQALAVEVLEWIRGTGEQTSESVASQFSLPIHAVYNIISSLKGSGEIYSTYSYLPSRDRRVPHHRASSTDEERL